MLCVIVVDEARIETAGVALYTVHTACRYTGTCLCLLVCMYTTACIHILYHIICKTRLSSSFINYNESFMLVYNAHCMQVHSYMFVSFSMYLHAYIYHIIKKTRLSSSLFIHVLLKCLYTMHTACRYMVLCLSFSIYLHACIHTLYYYL